MYNTSLRQRQTLRYIPGIVYYVVSCILSIIFIFPLAWMLLSTFKTPAEAAKSPPTFWPSHFSLSSYTTLFNYADGIGQHIGNSVLVTGITVVLTIIVSILGGYGFARFPFRGKNIVFILILMGLMIPYQVILTPIFLILHLIGLQNTLLGLGLVYTTFSLPFAIFVMRNSFENIPSALQDAALIDGCTPLSMLYRVMLPIAYPGVITVALFTFFYAWGEFLAALIFLTDSSKYTLPIYLVSSYSGEYGQVNWSVLQAGVAIIMLPCVVIFLLLQRYYIKGLTSGAVKA